RILLAGRLPMMALAILFGLALAWWTRWKFGAAAALAALAFYCLDPDLIAHSRYVATDVPVAALIFLASIAAVESLETGRLLDLFLASLLFALAAVTKYSALLLAPAIALLYVIRWWQRPREFPLRRLAMAAAAFTGVTLAVIAIVYWPETLRCLRGRAESFAEWGDPQTALGRTLGWMGKWLRLPTHTYPFGLQLLAAQNRTGHDAYLMGRHSQLGWWYYFPVAFAVKSTVAALLALLAVTVAGVRWLAARRLWRRLRDAPLIWYGLTVPPLVYFAISMTSTINAGMRYVLPVYPFLYVLAAAVLARGRWRFSRWLLAGLLAVQAAECIGIYPDYLAFFNVLSGGPGNGPKYLADSNIDWGQDVKKLAKWLKARGANRVYFRYFGSYPPGLEYLDCLSVPGTEDRAGRDAVDGFVAVSVTYLVGLYVPQNEYAWLRQMNPVAKVGYSIYVYDLRKRYLAASTVPEIAPR
ncbi:MAG TPA: hypothetical protein VE959_36425, partial [Bryobacteraceae bacterium]|nr:hypothetical protein [Bryobacteraceae bacterium]